MRTLIRAVLLSLAFISSAHAETDPWVGLRFLIGNWVGVGKGAPGEATGKFSFKLELDGKILVRKNHTDFPPKPGEKKGMRHSDQMIVFSESGKLKAIYFDNEGHTIRYLVTTSDGHATFESEEQAGVPRFKLDYDRRSDGSIATSFSIAPPGQPYRPYLTGTAVPSRQPSIDSLLSNMGGQTGPSEITATVSPTLLKLGEKATYTVTTAGADNGQLITPSFGELTVTGPQKSSQSQIQIVNGELTKKSSIVYTWTVSAPHPGEFAITPASLLFKDRTIQSNAVQAQWVSPEP